MPYHPDFHHRRSVRLRGYDYAKEGMYFVTICVQNRAHKFGGIRDKTMILNHFGEIAHQEWENLPIRWNHIELGEFQIMPNHMHGIIVIHRPALLQTGAEFDPFIPVGAALAAARGPEAVQNPEAAQNHPSNSSPNPFSKIQWSSRPALGQIIGAYKSRVFSECLKWQKLNLPGEWFGKLWQVSFHDHIISDARAFDNISCYIVNNPANWENDKFFE